MPYLQTIPFPRGSHNAEIMIVTDFASEQDVNVGTLFTGGQGTQLRKLLSQGGISFDACFITSVVYDPLSLAERELTVLERKTAVSGWTKYCDVFIQNEVIDNISRLTKEIELVKPKIIITLGNLSLTVLTGKGKALTWRASLLPCLLYEGSKVVCCLHPRMLYAKPELSIIMPLDFRRAIIASAPGYAQQEKKFIIQPNYQVAENVLKQLILQAANRPGEMLLAVDIETKRGQIDCVSCAWNSLEAICIPFLASTTSGSYWTEEEEVGIVRLLQQLFFLVRFVGQNFLYDIQYLCRQLGITNPYPVEDTMHKQHVLFNTMPKNLAFLSSIYCEDHTYWKDERSRSTRKSLEEDRQDWTYNCQDAVKTFEINLALDRALGTGKLSEVYTFQQKVAKAVLNTTLRGVRFDGSKRDSMRKPLLRLMEEWQEKVNLLAGRELNIQSPKQVADYFYNVCEEKQIRHRKTGTITTDVTALREIQERTPTLRPIVEAILKLRSLNVFYSTFVDMKTDVDGRMRTTYDIAGTSTYRFSSSENAFGSGGNFQNIPVGEEAENLPNIRTLFLPDDGKIMADTDLDSADLRIVANEARCKWLLAQLDAGNKVYVEVAKEYYKDPTITKAHPAYKIFKALCHGTHYLGTPEGMSKILGLLVHEVSKIQKWYFGLCPELKQWHDEIRKQVTGRRYIENVFGYRCHFHGNIEGTIFNQAVAWIPQSTVGIYINHLYVALDEHMQDKVEVLLQVHDSLVFQFDADKKEEILSEVSEHAKIILPYEKPTIIPMGIKTSSKNWGDCS